jgi:hypothetical protein
VEAIKQLMLAPKSIASGIKIESSFQENAFHRLIFILFSLMPGGTISFLSSI